MMMIDYQGDFKTDPRRKILLPTVGRASTRDVWLDSTEMLIATSDDHDQPLRKSFVLIGRTA
jgi:hypothetical protein